MVFFKTVQQKCQFLVHKPAIMTMVLQNNRIGIKLANSLTGLSKSILNKSYLCNI